MKPRPPRRSGARRGRRRRWLGAAAAGGAALLLYALFTGGRADTTPATAGAAPDSASPPPEPPPSVVALDTLEPGQSIGELLRRQGLVGAEYLSALERVSEIVSPRRLQPGLVVESSTPVPERVGSITLRIDADRSLHLEPADGGWTARLDSVAVTLDTVVLAGVVESTLWNARLSGDTALIEGPSEKGVILYLANSVYAWQVDFFRDIRRGDAFRVVRERQVRPDGTVRSARILAAEFYNDGRRLPAVRFEVPGRPPEYYDEEGEATRKAFLRAPLAFGRLTSGFSRRRYHPVLGSYRAHRGMDYGAARGTPVHATGSGKVTVARWWGGYGRVVEVRHNGAHRTRYAHLSDFARGIRPGVRVSQNQIIGYVGQSGLATGPHVHYEFLVNGTQRDPSRVELPPGDPVPDSLRQEFSRVRDARMELLRGVEVPGVPDAPTPVRTARAWLSASAAD